MYMSVEFSDDALLTQALSVVQCSRIATLRHRKMIGGVHHSTLYVSG